MPSETRSQAFHISRNSSMVGTPKRGLGFDNGVVKLKLGRSTICKTISPRSRASKERSPEAASKFSVLTSECLLK